jgi:hypothetical protein
MTDLTCPECGRATPPTGASHANGLDQPEVQLTTCEGCGSPLERNPYLRDEELDQWRLVAKARR